MKEASIRKAAVFLMSLGPEVGGMVMSKLPEDIVEEITNIIAKTGHVNYEEKRSVLGEFMNISSMISGIAFGGEETAKQILEAGFGTRMANSLLSRVTSYSEIKSFEHLKNVDSLTIANYIKNEHPQTIAVVLAHMDPRNSGPILELLPADLQGQVAHRMAILETPNQETLRAVEGVLASQLQGEVAAKDSKFGGKKQVAEVLNEIERETWQEILDEMREIDDEVANEVNNLMFVFEDIIMLSDASIQEVLKEIDGKELTFALKGATDEIQEKIFGNMSKRATEGIREDMEYMGPVKLSEVEEAQQRIVEVIRSLEEAGTISLGKGGKDAEMVT
ncbi:MAG: flagellar motor switch protein FliG [Gemmatimonadales bacterium]|nr:flagellar motor switch protein FliG [Gemmatimonadales bacterium]